MRAGSRGSTVTRCRAVGVGLASAILIASVVLAAPAGAAAARRKSGCARTAYVTNFGAGTVSVVDTKTAQVTGTITVGSAPYGVVFSPDGRART